MDTYEMCAGLVIAQGGGRVLDYGCGAGQIVGILRARGIDASGCDVFYGGGDYSTHIPAELAADIRRMQDGRIPFPDDTFDVVISNQVMEHVPDLTAVSREIARVLRPGGRAIHVFPDRGVWREGHCGIPFLHWFPKGSALRVYYAATLRKLGLGSYTTGKTAMQWSRDFCEWLDAWTHYRSQREVHAAIGGRIEHLEHLWFDARLGKRPLPPPLKRWVTRKLAGMVLVSYCINED